jgi:hypothetical protein
MADRELTFQTDLDEYEKAALNYGWKVIGWDALPTRLSTVLLGRWEDRHGNVIDPPATRECTPPRDGVRQHIISALDEREVFLRLPYYATIEEWRRLMFNVLMGVP